MTMTELTSPLTVKLPHHRLNVGRHEVTIRPERPRIPREKRHRGSPAIQENPVSPQLIFGNNSPTLENAVKTATFLSVT
jgi:hypothetical protein